MTNKEEKYFLKTAIDMHKGVSSIRLVTNVEVEPAITNKIETGGWVTVQVYVSLPERTLNRRLNKQF